MEMLDKVLVTDFEPVTHYPYREIIGTLSYLTNNTRPDLFSVSVLSRFYNSYGEIHWQAVKRILRYLNGTKDIGLNLFRKRPI